MRARSRLASALDGLGGYVGSAAVLAVVGLLALLVTLQSSNDMLLWTGGHTKGVEDGGLVRYRVQGENYTHVPMSSVPEGRSIDVYYKKSDPFTARLDSLPTRIVDVATTAVPLALAAGVLWLGVRRRHRMRYTPPRTAEAFGTGLDPEFVQRKLEQLRRPPS